MPAERPILMNYRERSNLFFILIVVCLIICFFVVYIVLVLYADSRRFFIMILTVLGSMGVLMYLSGKEEIQKYDKKKRILK
ncbi:hypothetical protein DUZ99_12025 [Xylanibacillus composti]|nr:hypothetical protein [Xylanibacillus composti]